MTISSRCYAVNSYLHEAKNYAKEILYPKKELSIQIAQPYHIPYYYTPKPYQSSFWNMIFPVRHRHDVHHYHHSERSSKKKKDGAAGLIALGIGATLAAAGLAYSFFSELGRYYNTLDDQKRLEKTKHYIERETSFNKLTPQQIYRLENIMDEHQDIINDFQHSTAVYLGAKAGVFGGLSSAAFAAFFAYLKGSTILNSCPQVALASVALTTVGTAIWIMKSGFDSTYQKVAKKAEHLLYNIYEAEKL